MAGLNERIRLKVKRASYQAMLRCRDPFLIRVEGAVRGGPNKTGTEKLFANALAEQFDQGYEREVPLTKIGSKQTTPDRASGSIDALLTLNDKQIGIEIKVVELPRANSTNLYGALYDIGQIASDHARLRLAKKIDGGVCLVFLYGKLLNGSNVTSRRVRRHFHNAMFVDYETARCFGELAEPKKRGGFSEIVTSIKILGFDHPFDPRQDGSICVVLPKRE